MAYRYEYTEDKVKAIEQRTDLVFSLLYVVCTIILFVALMLAAHITHDYFATKTCWNTKEN